MISFIKHICFLITLVISAGNNAFADSINNDFCAIELNSFEEVQARVGSAGKADRLKYLLTQKHYRVSKYPRYSIDFKKISWNGQNGKTFGEGYQFKIRDLKTRKIVSESNSYLRLIRTNYVLTGKRRQTAIARKMLSAIRNLKRCSTISKGL